MALSEKQERAAARRRAFLLKEGTDCPSLPAQVQGAKGDEAQPVRGYRSAPVCVNVFVYVCVRARVHVFYEGTWSSWVAIDPQSVYVYE